jgi:hypothetical protein
VPILTLNSTVRSVASSPSVLCQSLNRVVWSFAARITANIRQEYRVKIHEAGNKLRAAVRNELDQIISVIK